MSFIVQKNKIGGVSPRLLQIQISNNTSITTKILSVSCTEDDIDLEFEVEPTAGELTELDSIISAHTKSNGTFVDLNNCYQENEIKKGLLMSVTCWADNSKTQLVQDISFEYDNKKLVKIITKNYDIYGYLDETITEIFEDTYKTIATEKVNYE